jgi:hypothetical protein
MRAGSDIVDSSSHFPMIGVQLCYWGLPHTRDSFPTPDLRLHSPEQDLGAQYHHHPAAACYYFMRLMFDAFLIEYYLISVGGCSCCINFDIVAMGTYLKF